MYLMIDNYDSFVYNLKAYFEELGKEIAVIRCDKITLKESYLITNGITEPADILFKKLEDAILKTSDSEPIKPAKEKYPIQVHANFEKEEKPKKLLKYPKNQQ